MLTIGTDPSLPLAARETAFLRGFEALRSGARAQVDAGYDDAAARAAAEHNGEASAARDALVMPVGGHRMIVDPDLYASALDDDDGLIVEAGDVDDVNPPSVADPSDLARAQADTYEGSDEEAADLAVDGGPGDGLSVATGGPVDVPAVEAPDVPAPAGDVASEARTGSRESKPDAVEAQAALVAEMKGDDLRDALRAAGLPTSGRVDDLRARLSAHYAAHHANPATDPDTTEENSP